MITQECLKSLFDYKDGNLILKVTIPKSRKRLGECMGSLKRTGYIEVTIKKKQYLAHRLVYIWHNGEIKDNLQIDHINRIRNDNRIENLRLVTHQENQWNNNLNKSKGYRYIKNIDMYNARITVNRKNIHLGNFKTKEQAHQVYLEAKKKYHIIGVNQ